MRSGILHHTPSSPRAVPLHKPQRGFPRLRMLPPVGVVILLWALGVLAGLLGSWLPRTVQFPLTVSQPFEVHTLYLLDAERGLIVPLTEHLLGAYAPSLAPDGRSVAFIHVGQGTTDVFLDHIYDSDSYHLNLTGYTMYTSWSPDSSQLAYVSLPLNGIHHNIYAVSAQGGEPRLVVDMDYGSNTPSWSPDSAYLVFVAGYQFDRADLYVVPSDCGDCEAERLHFSQLYGSELNPSWSPDGKQIAFMLIQVGRLGIYTLDTTCIYDEKSICFEQAPRLITSGTGIMAPLMWSADSQRILYTKVVRGLPEVFSVDAACDAPLQGCAPVQVTHLQQTYLRW